jgi:hypothetical protein
MCKKLRPTILMASIFLSGCASTPQGTISYYFPKAQTQLTITQTLSCNTKGDQVSELLSVTPLTAYVSDLKVPPWAIEPKSFDGALSDTDIALSFTDDGRLSGINLTSAGQGSTVIQDIVAVAKAVAPALAAASPGTTPDPAKACGVIADYSGKVVGKGGGKGAGAGAGKGAVQGGAKDDATPAGDAQAEGSAPPSVSLTYVARFEYGLANSNSGGATATADTTDQDTAQSGAVAKSVNVPIGIRSLEEKSSGDQYSNGIAIAPDPGSTALYNALLQYLPKLPLEVDVKGAKQILASTWSNASDSDIRIKLNSVANVIITVMGPSSEWTDRDVIWTGQVPVPLTDDKYLYFLPIPKAAVFGTAKFSLGLSGYGSIEKLEYSTTGASDAANSANAVASGLAAVLKKPTAADQAASIQAQSDLIYQQQRLIACQAAPKSCPSK